MEEVKGPIPRTHPTGAAIRIRIHLGANPKPVGCVTLVDTADVNDLRRTIENQWFMFKKERYTHNVIMRTTPDVTGESLNDHLQQKLWQAPLFDATTKEPVAVYVDLVAKIGGLLKYNKEAIMFAFYCVWFALDYRAVVEKQGENIPPGFGGLIQWAWVFPAVGFIIWLIFEAPACCCCCWCCWDLGHVRYSLLRCWVGISSCCCFFSTRSLLKRKEEGMGMRRWVFPVLFVYVAVLVAMLAGVRSSTLAGYLIAVSVLEIFTLTIEIYKQARWWDFNSEQEECEALLGYQAV